MTDRDIAKCAGAFLKQYTDGAPTCDALKNALQKQGFTVIAFSNLANDADVDDLARALGVQEMILRAKGFTYMDARMRLVFLNSDLSDEEARIVLAHEEGHICCNHFDHKALAGRDVTEEHEANEFAHVVLTAKRPSAVLRFCKRHLWLLLLLAALVAAAIAVPIVVTRCVQTQAQQSATPVFGDYYLTATGSKYHLATCGYVAGKEGTHKMTKAEFDSGLYSPCKYCLSQYQN